MISPSETTVGFAGLGNLGAPMARRLLDVGWRVTVHDVTEHKTQPFAQAGATVAGSVADVLACDVLVLAVPDDHAVESLLLGPDGYYAGDGSGRLVIVHSTILPATAQRLADVAADHGVGLIDAPVSGGADRAADGDLTLFLGAEPDTAARADRLLGSVASTVEHVGPPGAGAAVKLANQLMLFATLAGAHEALAMAGGYGVDEGAVLRAVGTSTGASWVTDHWGFFDRTAQAYTAAGTPVTDRPWSKDLLEILAAARAVGVEVPVAAVTSQTLAPAVEQHAHDTARPEQS